MKKYSLLSIFITLIFLFFVLENIHSQSLEITGDTFVYGNPSIPLASYIVVKNTTNSSLDIICKKNIIDTVSGTQNYFCWGSQCWPSTTYISSNSIFSTDPSFEPLGVRTIPAGFADSNNFTGYYDAAFLGIPMSNRAVVEYCFFPVGDISDSICLTIHYNDNLSSTFISYPDFELTEFYPNPSSNKTSIKYRAKKKSQLDIIDILGNKIKSYELNNSGHLDIKTSDLSSGLYFGNLVIDKRVVALRKLIIN